MPKTTEKTMKEPILTVRIVPGKATPAQREKWRRFWQHLIAQAKSEAGK